MKIVVVAFRNKTNIKIGDISSGRSATALLLEVKTVHNTRKLVVIANVFHLFISDAKKLSTSGDTDARMERIINNFEAFDFFRIITIK
jgi:hypothetical protein